MKPSFRFWVVRSKNNQVLIQIPFYECDFIRYQSYFIETIGM